MAYMTEYYMAERFVTGEILAGILFVDYNDRVRCNVCLEMVPEHRDFISKCCHRVVCSKCLDAAIGGQLHRPIFMCPVMKTINMTNPTDHIFERGCYDEQENPFAVVGSCATCGDEGRYSWLCCDAMQCGNCHSVIPYEMGPEFEILCEFCGNTDSYKCLLCDGFCIDKKLICCNKTIHVCCIKKWKNSKSEEDPLYSCPMCRDRNSDPIGMMQPTRLMEEPVVASWLVLD